jgi:alkylhydroperoxidase family enzyme
VPGMARVPYLDPDTAPDAVASRLAKLPPLHVFRLLAHAETAFVPWLRFGGALLADLALDPALRELVILQVGRLAARYEWDQHVPIARDAGVSSEQIDALEQGRLDQFDDATRAALEFAAALVDGEVDDATYAAVAEHLDDRGVVELSLVAGHYLMLARIMTALRIDPDTPAGSEALLGRSSSSR